MLHYAALRSTLAEHQDPNSLRHGCAAEPMQVLHLCGVLQNVGSWLAPGLYAIICTVGALEAMPGITGGKRFAGQPGPHAPAVARTGPTELM